MGIDYAAHRAAVEMLYEDRATILRRIEVTKPSGETVLSADPVAVYTDQPCHLSQSGLPKNGQTEAQNDIRYEVKLFIAPELVIRQGDVIRVTRATNQAVTTYTAGEPFPPYGSHQEVGLLREGYA